jgi:hypothetical protein
MQAVAVAQGMVMAAPGAAVMQMTGLVVGIRVQMNWAAAAAVPTLVAPVETEALVS